MIQFIIQIFKTKLNNKIEEFINNIDKNKEAQNFFTTCDILNENKQLKINEKINTYIKALKKREEESGIKAFFVLTTTEINLTIESIKSKRIYNSIILEDID